MPMAGAGAPAEEFDSTIAPPTGNVSSIGLPGPDTAEAPVHTGMVNNLDNYFTKQYIALEQFTWSTDQDPATLLFAREIHPLRSHQWMQYLSKIYNTYAGGFDFAFKVAGTGFHAGAIIIVRLPPNIPPADIRSLADLTAFEYEVIDPKTLEVEIKSVMDQRNVMFHWIDKFNITDPQTYGGTVAAYVMLPLNTSSTGATQINVQVWTKPSFNFRFNQVRPLSIAPTPETGVKDIVEQALDFSGVARPFKWVRDMGNIISIDPAKVVTYDLMDVFKADGTQNVAPNLNELFEGHVFMAPSTIISNVRTNGIKKTIGEDNWHGLDISASGAWIEMTFKPPQTAESGYYHFAGNCIVRFGMSGAPEAGFTFYSEVTMNNLERTQFNLKNILNQDYFKGSKKDPTGWKDQGLFEDDFYKWCSFVSITPYDDNFYADHISNSWSPPVGSECIVAPQRKIAGSQFETVRHLFATKKISRYLQNGQAIFLELYDVDAGLPIGKWKLYWEGFMTTTKPQKTLLYDFYKGKYRFNYLKIGPGSTPLYSNAKELAYYKRQQALANLYASVNV